MWTLEEIEIQNFKSIRHQKLRMGRLNLFIGGNGSGKSNLIQVFQFLREIYRRNLAAYSLRKGADSLLYPGRKRSPFLVFRVVFGDMESSNGYRILLSPTDEGSLIVSGETASFHIKGSQTDTSTQVSSGGREALIGRPRGAIAHYSKSGLESYRVYHFHDTSESAPVKGEADVHDNQELRKDAGNLAPFLYFLEQRHPDHFRNIEDTVRQIAPFFDRFNLKPSRLNPEKIRLEWLEKGSDSYFNASSLSDGTLRFICLATLLLQPTLPAVVLLDEPELGLHPAAITLLASLLSAAAERTQVLVATQSVNLINQFGPEDVWTVDREDGQSVFRRLSEQDMSVWLDEYALGELWEKNVLGARP